MTLNCFVILCTSNGRGFAEVRVNSLHQLARLMPASVVSYVASHNGDSARGPIRDAELYDLLMGLISDIDGPPRQ